MGNSTIKEKQKVVIAIDNADISTDRTSAFYNAVDFRRVYAKLETGTVAATKIATIELLQGKGSDGTDAKRLGSLVTFTAPDGGAAAAIDVESHLDAIDSENGFDHVAVKVTSDNSTALAGAVALILGESRYSPVV